MERTLGLIKRLIKKLKVKALQLSSLTLGTNVECNICHYKTYRFNSDSWHLHSRCPKCHSEVRQRLLIASLTLLEEFSFGKIIKDKKILHFAPEKIISNLIKDIAKEYKTADFFAEGYHYDNIDFNIDISDMNPLDNETFDCVIACDVLEHVPDHVRGIQEVHRILKRDGYCIFTVPQKDHLKSTYEDGTIVDKKEREKAFGQFDHLRIYGDDFVTFLQNSGFAVTAVDENFFDRQTAKKFVLFPPILSKHPLATNFRKVFFGKKITGP